MGYRHLKLHSMPGVSGGAPGNADQEAASILAGVEDEHGAHSPENSDNSPGQQVPSLPTVEIVRPAVVMLCETFFPGKKIAPVHMEACVKSYAAVIDYYFPGGVSHPVIAAVLATGILWITYREPKPEKEPDPNAPQA
jgi:hypothetical protein